MANNHDYVALDWVQGEIITTLEEAQAALEAYVGQPEDKSRLRFCLNHLHQIHGTLQMVEFYGAAALAEEMEKLAEAILNDTVSSQEESIEVLMESMLQLPNYLERLRQSRRDIPLVLMPTLNDLRAARGEALLTNNALFSPDLTSARRPAKTDQAARMADPRTVTQLRKVRQMYQFALVGVIREKDVQTNLELMHKALHYLEGLAKDTAHEEFWRCATGLIDAFEHKQLTLSLSVKSLFRMVDLRIKRMIEEPITIFGQKLPEDTLKNLLYYIACAEPVTDRLKSIRDDYKLDEALPKDAAIAEERAKLSGPDRSAISSVVSALNEELSRIKDQLDLFVRDSFKDIDDLLSLLPGLTQLGNTLTILGLGQPRKLVQDLVARLDALEKSREVPNDDALMHMAGLLLQVENQLAKMGESQGASETEEESFIPKDQLANAHDAVIREARNEIEQIKLAIVEFIGSQWDLTHIEKVPDQLRTIQGGLKIIPLEKASTMMGACADFIQHTLIDQGKTPDWQQLDTLADAVTSIEYYLERMTEGGDNNELILQVAEDSLKRLAEDTPQPVGKDDAGERQLASEKATDHDLIDDEIREIFVEEAGEVISTMMAHFPAWQENPFDKPSLIELRRAFHTLKGSGRLVGATDISELSWAIENLLNRVIEGSLEPNLAIFELVENTIHKIPSLIDSFSAGRAMDSVSDLMEQANVIASTRTKASEKGSASLSEELAPPPLTEPEPTLEASADHLITEAPDGEEAEDEHSRPSPPVGVSVETSEITGADNEDTADEIHVEVSPPKPPVQAPVSSVSAEEDLIDDEIIEIFVEEAGEVLGTIGQYLPVFLNNYDSAEARTEVRRAFHTLKGSGRMVGAKDVGELAWSIENLLNRVLDNTVKMSSQIGDLINHVVSMLPDMVTDFEQRRPPSHDVAPLMAHAHAIAKGEIPSTSVLPVGGQPAVKTSTPAVAIEDASPPSPPYQEAIDQTIAEPEVAIEPEPEIELAEVELAEVAPTELETDALPTATVAEEEEDADHEGVTIDPTLLEIFRSETETHLQTLREFVVKAKRDHNQRINDDVSRAMHTLKGSANTASVAPIAKVVIPAEKLFKEIRGAGLRVDDRIAALIDETADFVEAGLAQLNSHPQRPLEGTEKYLHRLAQASAELLDTSHDVATLHEAAAPDPQLLNIFLTEGIDILLDAERILQDWRDKGVSAPEQHMLVTELQTLAQGAQLAGLDDVRQLSTVLEKAYREIETRRLAVNAPVFDMLHEAHEQLINMMDQVAAGLATHPDQSLMKELADTIAALPTLPEDMAVAELPELEAEAEAEAAEPETPAETDAPESFDEAVPTLSIEEVLQEPEEELPLAPLSLDDDDNDIAEIFLEEAEDLIDSSSETLGRWSDDRANMPLVHSLQRDLHTLKGGARLASQNAIADLAHELESLFEAITLNRIQVSDEAINLSMLGHDGLARMVGELKQNGRSEAAPQLINTLHAFIAQELSGDQGDLSESEDDHIIGVDSLPDQGFDELDLETVELFLEEADEIIHRTGETLNSWSNDLSDRELLATLQRDLHTLKGGARLAGIRPIGDLSHEMETLFEQMNEGRFAASSAMASLLIICHDRLAHMVEAVKAHDAIPSGDDLIARLLSFDESDADMPVAKAAPQETIEPEDEEIIEAESVPVAVSSDSVEETFFDPTQGDPELMELFLSEAQELTDETASQLHAWHENPENSEAMASLLRALHTLKGGARLAEIRPIGDLSHALETLLEGLVGGTILPSRTIVALTHAANDKLVDMIQAATAGSPVRSENAMIKQIDALIHGQPEASAEGAVAVSEGNAAERLHRVLIEESRQSLANMVGGFDRWQMGETSAIRVIYNEAEKLSGAASLANVPSISRLADALSRFITQEEQSASKDPRVTTLAERALRYLGRLIDQIEQQEEPETPNELIEELLRVDVQSAPTVALDDIDDDILQVFIEEADELMGGLQRAFEDWRRDTGHLAHADTMQRQLHTLKGGARLATLTNIGDVSQELEAVVKDASDHKRALDTDLQLEIGHLFDKLQQLVQEVKDGYRQKVIRDKAQAAGEATVTPEHRAATEKVVQMQREQAAAPSKAPAPMPAPDTGKAASSRDKAGDTVRVGANLLDSLVNLAGETSITRGLLEQQISDFSHTLSEMQATIDRLREQLRRMDIETEAQVLFRMEKEAGPAYEDFDPLEMDRYSSIQQLSRALSESASDLTDLRETLLERSRGAETLLLQQARINTELQEGLMKTRMVPFTSIVPRLRRIVRQVATELGKQANFEVYNPEGELDRTVLERMVAPLEHMLRNAMDHGIESPEKRRKAGKPEAGTINLSLSREGGDVVIVLSDDGGGINTDAIRKKAISQGMIDEDSVIPAHEMLQFIFKAGFSTAEKVTQLSGRGVGMDVVASEIKQLGGRVAIHSEMGKGTRFVIHLPFTVSVNRALMVSTGEDYYAIPLNTIEGIVRVSTFELEEYYKPDAPLYEYAGQRYRLQYLGSLLHSEHHPKLQGQPLPLPVILVRGGDQPLALQVDSLMGSREIVVKGLGKQFAGVRGVSGATILGDGSVVVILDLPAMIRNDLIPGEDTGKETKTEQRVSSGPKTVMVVDDSVTVRKVTTRLLERHGMEVITAKDGVDAIALLQDHKPDVMLLDIEMPRMDGFEVASLVRHDKRLAEVPIIMITSRTGQKHRERAISIGVNEYMGKPFQENNLLEAIERLTGGK